MKSIILAALAVVVFLVWLGFKTDPSISSRVNESDFLPIQEKTQTKEVEEDSVPWQELRVQWQQELEQTLIQQGLEPDSKMLKDYLAAKQKYEKMVDESIKEQAATYTYDRKTGNIIFHDRTKYEQYKEMIQQIKKFHIEKTKTIFGEHYEVLKTRYAKFRHGIQAHNHNDAIIGVDMAFETEE